jgi:hypothetical protein
MPKEFYPNTQNLRVLTPTGYQAFAGISLMRISKVWRLTLESSQWLECSDAHRIYVNGEEYKPLSQLAPGDQVFTLSGFKQIVSIEDTGRTEPVYDLVEVDGGHRYYTNGILSSNCQFISFEETLINSLKLSALTGVTPLRTVGQVRWYSDPRPECTYIVALDPSMGTGGDNAAIQVIELPSLTQVAEWCSNRASIEQQVKVMRDILEEIVTFGEPELYWSLESNTLGEAALVVVRDTGEENFPGTMLHDPKNRLGGKTGRRAGFVTTNKSKLESCARLKTLIETERLKIKSKALISELKVFVSRANSYEAKSGQRDDLVMAMILALRMIEFVATWDDGSHAAVNSNILDDDDNYDQPMPIFI